MDRGSECVARWRGTSHSTPALVPRSRVSVVRGVLGAHGGNRLASMSIDAIARVMKV